MNPPPLRLIAILLGVLVGFGGLSAAEPENQQPTKDDIEQEQLEKGLADKDVNVRRKAANKLQDPRGMNKLPLIEKALADQDTDVRKSASNGLYKQLAHATCRIGLHVLRHQAENEKIVLPMVEKALSDDDAQVREWANLSLGRIGGEKALALLEKGLADKDANVRGRAAEALGNHGWSKASWYFARALSSEDAYRHFYTATVGKEQEWGKKAVPLLEKAFADENHVVRMNVAEALGYTGGDMARDVLLDQLIAEKDPKVLEEISKSLREHYADDPAVQKALKDAEARQPKEKPQPSQDEF